jgi:cysteine-rich repeat protein
MFTSPIAASRAATSTLVVSLATVGVLLIAGNAPAAINATTADDICAPATDPCVISETVTVVPPPPTPEDPDPPVLFDFGLRTFQIASGGEVDARDFSVTIRAGRIVVGGKGIVGVASGEGAVVRLEAQGTCSNDAGVACLTDGICGAGTCTGGDGTISTNTLITATTAFLEGDEEIRTPGFVGLFAASDIVIDGKIDVSTGDPDSDAGDIDIDSAHGSVTIQTKLVAVGGGLGTGGDITIGAGTDILIERSLSLFGGDGDGGSVLLEADRDVVITDGINCNSASGGGSGGYVDVAAGRDVRIEGVSPTNRVTILADGHKDSDDFAGDGGDHSYAAGRDILINEFVTLTSNGPTPDGFGGEIAFDSVRDLVLDADVEVKGKGLDGSGGSIDMFSTGSLNVGAPAKFDLTAGDSGGSIDATSVGPFVFDGEFDATTLRGSGVGGDVFFSSDDSATIGGELVTDGDGALFFITACRLEVTATGILNNLSEFGSNELEARESMIIREGARVEAKDDGENFLTYRTDEKLPVVGSGVDPDPILREQPALIGCPVCGNSEIDQGESCDDGNTVDEDGCAAQCQLDSCVDQTPGFPAVPICDDASACTDDTCNVNTGDCEYSAGCDDGVSCTVDACVEEECVSTPNDGRCDDATFCNGSEVCDSAEDCQAGTPPDCSDAFACTDDSCSVGSDSCVNTTVNARCDDFNFCNGDEVCVAGLGCQGTVARDCDDDVSCTDDACDGPSDQCVNSPVDDRCPDDVCGDGICVAGLGCELEPNGVCATTTTLGFELICGDANLNGSVTAADAFIALRTAVELDTCDLRTCDVNGDGTVTSSDSLAILRLAVLLPDETNCNFGGGVAANTTPSTSLPQTSTTVPFSSTTTLPR